MASKKKRTWDEVEDEEIERANELGRLLQETDSFKRAKDVSKPIKLNPDGSYAKEKKDGKRKQDDQADN